MNVSDNLAKQFKAGELMRVAEALGLSPTSRWGARKLVDVILTQCKQGVPRYEGPKDMTELVDDFLYVAGLTDESGNVIEAGSIPPQDGEHPTLEVFLREHSIACVPACYGYYDDQDPACPRCPLPEYCGEERIHALPPCIGLLFDAADPQCKRCFEAPACSAKNGSS